MTVPCLYEKPLTCLHQQFAKGQICLQCGDEGFTNAYVYCVKCLEYAVHRYCLPEIPQTFEEVVVWHCNDCEVELKGGDFSSKHIGYDSITKSQNESSRHLTNCVEDGQVQSGPLLQSPCEKLDVRKEGHVQNGSLLQSLSEKGDEREDSQLTSDSCHSNDKLNADSDSDLIVEYYQGCQPSNSASQAQARPVADPIWRGSFSILNNNDDALEGFVAHVSDLACEKVYEEARMLPPLLHLQMLPKIEVWPKSFQKAQPTDNNIALYIFPADRRYERTFDQLVGDLTDKEYAMRVTVKNAELLIFPSTELPLRHWRFQNKHYLWGVFRAKQPPPNPGNAPVAPKLARGRMNEDRQFQTGPVRYSLRNACN